MTLHLIPPMDDDEPFDEPYEDPSISSATDGQARAKAEGTAFDQIAYDFIERSGGTIERGRHSVGVVNVDARVRGSNGKLFWILAHGNVDVDSSATLPGLRRTDTIRKAGNTAMLLHHYELAPLPVILVTSHLPGPKDRSATKLLQAHRPWIWDVIATYGDLAGYHRLRRYMNSSPAPTAPDRVDWCRAEWEQLTLGEPGEWTDA